MASTVIAELSQATGVSEEQAAKVLAVLGFEEKSTAGLKVAGLGFDQVKLADLRISAKVGRVVVAR